jgi:hypothetical protein
MVRPSPGDCPQPDATFHSANHLKALKVGNGISGGFDSRRFSRPTRKQRLLHLVLHRFHVVGMDGLDAAIGSVREKAGLRRSEAKLWFIHAVEEQDLGHPDQVGCECECHFP